jgi:septum formation protein
MRTIILASQSPRRRQLIDLLNCPVTAVSADVDESRITTPDPAQNAIDTARFKAETILARWPVQLPAASAAILVAADTTVALERQMLGKPVDNNEAAQMLRQLRGQEHEVHTGMVVVDLASGRSLEAVTTVPVTMRDYSRHEIEAYVATGDPLDKAGAYAIQHTVFRPVARLEGCYLGVMGLSICHLLRLLQQIEPAITADTVGLRQSHNGYTCPYLNHQSTAEDL